MFKFAYKSIIFWLSKIFQISANQSISVWVDVFVHVVMNIIISLNNQYKTFLLNSFLGNIYTSDLLLKVWLSQSPLLSFK